MGVKKDKIITILAEAKDKILINKTCAYINGYFSKKDNMFKTLTKDKMIKILEETKDEILINKICAYIDGYLSNKK